jgi:RNA polymerase sigma factor (sigma-70 family)
MKTPKIAHLKAAIDRLPKNHLALREMLIDRLVKGKRPAEAALHRAFLAYLRDGGKPAICCAAEMLIEVLADRGANYTAQYVDGRLRLEADEFPAADLAAEGDELVLLTGGFRHSAQLAAIVRLANLIVPEPACYPEPDADDDLHAGTTAKMSKANSGILPDGADPFLLARALTNGDIFARAEAEVRKRFPPAKYKRHIREGAEEAAHRAVMRAIYYFDGWNRLDLLALSYVDNALRSFIGGLYRTKKGKRTNKMKPQTFTNCHEGKEDVDGEFIDDHLFDTAAPVEAAGESAATAELVSKMLAALPPGEAEIMRRHHIEGETVKDIARSLGCTVRMVQRSLKASREFLAEQF